MRRITVTKPVFDSLLGLKGRMPGSEFLNGDNGEEAHPCMHPMDIISSNASLLQLAVSFMAPGVDREYHGPRTFHIRPSKP